MQTKETDLTKFIGPYTKDPIEQAQVLAAIGEECLPKEDGAFRTFPFPLQAGAKITKLLARFETETGAYLNEEEITTLYETVDTLYLRGIIHGAVLMIKNQKEQSCK